MSLSKGAVIGLGVGGAAVAGLLLYSTSAHAKALPSPKPKPKPKRPAVKPVKPHDKEVADAARKKADEAQRKAEAAARKARAEQKAQVVGDDLNTRAPRRISVMGAQKLLMRLGARNLVHKSSGNLVDGLFGPRTQAAWQAASKNNGLPTLFTRVDGKTATVNSATAERLAAIAGKRPAVDMKVVSDKKPADAKPAQPAQPKPQEAQPAQPKPKPKPLVEAAKVSVLRAQQAVNALAEATVLETDGLYGPKTQAAWNEAAKKRGLHPGFTRVDANNATAPRDTIRAILTEAEGKSAQPTQTVVIPPGFNRAKAKATANDIAAHIRQSGKAYNKKRLAQWQTLAGLEADGFYGPLSQSALTFYGAKAPPALYTSKNPNKTYKPPA